MRKDILLVGPTYMEDEIRAYRCYLNAFYGENSNHQVIGIVFLSSTDGLDYLEDCYKSILCANVILIFTEDGYCDMAMNHVISYIKTLIGGSMDPTILLIRGRERYEHKTV